MGAESFVVYYGVRYAIEDESESEMLSYSTLRSSSDGSPIDGLDADRWHPKVRAALSADLQWTWGYTQEETYYLLIGKELGSLGWEHKGDVSVPTQELEAAIAEIKQRLQAAGINEPVGLHAQHEPDF
jgi:hypothetical protein